MGADDALALIQALVWRFSHDHFSLQSFEYVSILLIQPSSCNNANNFSVEIG